MTSAIAELTATASTPDGRAFATIAGRTHVRMSLGPGYYGWASVTDLERQLTRLAKLLFVARMRAYYEARSRDFQQLYTREPAPTTPLDQAYVRARAEVVVEGEAAGGAVRTSAVGMDSWAVHLDRDVKQRMDEVTFCDTVSRAATPLLELQLAGERETGAAAPPYDEPTVGVEAPCTSEGFATPTVQPDVSCVVNAPQRTPYLPGHGWAEDGRTFVLVTAFLTVDRVEVRGTSHDVDQVTPRLTLDGADPLPPDGRYGAPEHESGAASGTWAFGVPDETVGELTISLDCLLDGDGDVTLEQTVPLG